MDEFNVSSHKESYLNLILLNNSTVSLTSIKNSELKPETKYDQ